MLEYSMKLDFESFKNSTKEDAIKILLQNILVTIEKAIVKFNINSFNIALYRQELRQLAIDKGWINE